MKTIKKIFTVACAAVLTAVMLLGSGCGTKKAATVMEKYEGQTAVTINDKEIMITDVMYQIFGLEINGAYYDDLYQTYYGSSFWEAPFTDEESGETVMMREYLKDEIMQEIIIQEILAMEAEKAEMLLTKEEIEDYTQQIITLVAQLGTQEEPDSYWYIGFTQENLADQFRIMALASKYYGYLEEGFGVDEEEIRSQIKYEDYREYVTDNLCIQFNSYDEEYNLVEMTEDEKKESRAAMEEALALVQEGKSFEEAAEELKEKAFFESGSLAFTLNSEQYEEEYRKAAAALSVGECSGIVETSNAIYLIRLTDDESQDAYEAAVAEAVETAVSDMFSAKYKEIEANYTITVSKEWDKLIFGEITTVNPSEANH